jgi:hypothetical protein
MAIRDGEWELIEWDAHTGRTVWSMFDGKKIIIRHDYPVAQTIQENAEARNAASDGWKGDYHRIASIPLNLLYDDNLGLNKAVQQGDDKYVSRWLNDGDNRAWRVKEGSI